MFLKHFWLKEKYPKVSYRIADDIVITTAGSQNDKALGTAGPSETQSRKERRCTMQIILTPDFERSFRSLVQTWEHYEALRGSTDLTARAHARYELDRARWDAAGARRALRATAA